jgi:FkbM family methyltransferase
MENKWTVTLEEDPETGDLILPLPQDILDLQGWVEGDTLNWVDNKDGSWSIQKNKMKTFIQIGAGAGDLDPNANFIDGFTRMVKSLDPATVGRVLLVEPNPVNIPFLEKCWKDYPQAEIYNIGICPSNFTERLITFYYFKKDGPHYQCTSIKKEHTGQSDLGEFKTACETLTEFLNRTVDKTCIDVLALDIEGIDGDVILDTAWNDFNIDQLSFEYTNLGNQTEPVKQHLEKYGFEFVGKGLDRDGLDWMYQKRK